MVLFGRPIPTGSRVDWLESRLYFYALAERDGTITSWRVTYPAEGGLNFEELQVINSYTGPKNTNVIPAETELSFIYTSNRNDSYYVIPALSPGNSITEVSDSLTIFMPHEDGALEVLQYQPAGGLMPRHFKLNKAGDLVGVSLQDTQRVVILERDVETGLLGDF
ncbi:hypothetical protein diail_6501 [Diaporthe ilicicola]|nr:hypothetical protein diail_6501 [Diaporthe ilicicola]